MSRDLAADFEAFHAANPLVYELFSRFTYDVIKRGHQHYSADAVMHRVRWHTSVETHGDEFKINNNHIAFYARLWMKENRHHDGFFETRVQKAVVALEEPEPEPPPAPTPEYRRAEQLGLL